MDTDQAGTVTGVSQMGGEGMQWIGMAPFLGQRPASGMTVPQIVRLLQAEGVAKVIVTTEDLSRYRNTKMPNGVAVWDRSRLDEAQRVLAATSSRSPPSSAARPVSASLPATSITAAWTGTARRS